MALHKPMKTVLIMAGGTGGHVFPGLALADYLRSHQVDVHWLGTSLGLEAKLVPEADLPLHLISIGGLRGKGIKPILTAPWKISKAIQDSLRIIRSVNPDVVIGMGGFVSGPGGIASWLNKRPLIIHEQNAKAGFTNKLLSRFARRTLQGFPAAFTSHNNVITVGNPVRSNLMQLPAPELRLTKTPSPFRLLVIGGSLGAQALNTIVPKALAQIPLNLRPEVLHQTGEKHFVATKDAYAALGVTADLRPFIHQMAEAYAWADMVLCRAGALTVAELCAVGLGAILVPFPFAVDDHQTANAHFMVKNNAALCIQQSDLTETHLADVIKQFSVAPEKRIAMANAAYQLRQENVTESIFNICQEVCL